MQSLFNPDHNRLLNLDTDSHQQYVMWTGRSGGQTVIGGLGSGNTLQLFSTSHATKGGVKVGSGGTPDTLILTDYVAMNRQSSSQEREVARITPSLPVTTDATRTGRVQFYVTDFGAQREILRLDATGTAAAASCFGDFTVSSASGSIVLSPVGGAFLTHNRVGSPPAYLWQQSGSGAGCSRQNYGSGIGYTGNLGGIYYTNASGATTYHTFTSTHYKAGTTVAVILSRTTTVADAELAAGEVALWFDSTNGASKLMIKGKSANGTVVSGNVALS